jgi:hypothetical protein
MEVNIMPSQIFSVWRTGKSTIAKLIIQSRKKDHKLQNYFRRNDKLNMGNVEDFLDRRFPSGDMLSAIEMVAVFSLLAANEPYTNVIQALTRLSEEGTGNRFDDKFFHSILNTSRDLKNLGLDKEAGDLLKIGESAAQIHHEARWESLFGEMIDIGLGSRIRDYPFMPQRGW